MLTFDCERRLFWSKRSFKQWGSILFFLNRYCGVIGHAPIFIQLFARPGSALYPLCGPVYSYHQFLAVIMQTIVVCMPPRFPDKPCICGDLTHRRTVTFLTRTYALYDRSRLVLVGLTSLALAGSAVGGVGHSHLEICLALKRIDQPSS